jgi:hypothetical protein
VNRFVHPEHHAFTKHRAERRDDGRRGEGLIVTKHLLNVLVAVHDEHRQRFLVRKRSRRLESLHRFLATQSGQFGVRVTHVTGYRVVERAEVC